MCGCVGGEETWHGPSTKRKARGGKRQSPIEMCMDVGVLVARRRGMAPYGDTTCGRCVAVKTFVMFGVGGHERASGKRGGLWVCRGREGMTWPLL